MREPELPLYDMAKKAPALSKTDSNSTAPTAATLPPGYAIKLAARHKIPNEELAERSTAIPAATPTAAQTANAGHNASTALGAGVSKTQEPEQDLWKLVLDLACAYGLALFLLFFALGLLFYDVEHKNEIWWARQGSTSTVISTLWIQIGTLFVIWPFGKMLDQCIKQMPRERRKANGTFRSIQVAAIIGVAFFISRWNYMNGDTSEST